jgi:hypothetical protein
MTVRYEPSRGQAETTVSQTLCCWRSCSYTKTSTHLDVGIQLWGCAATSSIRQNTDIPKQGTARYCECPMVVCEVISIIQRSQSNILRMIANAPWYVPNITLHEDLNVPLVKEIIEQRSTRNHNKFEGHVNLLIQPLLEPHIGRRLERNWPADLRFWISLFTSYWIRANYLIESM